jgi:uncharacterized Zn-finger protein
VEEMPEKLEKSDKQIIDAKLQYEIVEADADEIINEDLLWEETIEESSDINEESVDINDESAYIYSEEESQSTTSVLKIEKIEGNQTSLKRSRDEMELDQGESNEYYEENLEEYEISKDESSLDEEVVECELCRIQVLQSQVELHAEIMHKDFVCEKCNTTFPSKILFKIHNNETHSALVGIKGHKSRRKYHFCGLCDKEYEYKKHLEDHVRSFHKKERNRQCNVCLKWFYHRDIKKHIEHVHGEKKVSCNVCGKRYTCLENLKLHMRYHDEPKYICELPECGKKFHQKILWEHHMLKHSSDKPVECSQCGGSFYTVRGK